MLNSAQRDAVLTRSGPMLILAGAGTGKTRVITLRMAELIKTGVPAERILSVTFTNKAAREMKQRTTALLGKKVKTRPHISTFHSLCVRILRQEIGLLGYPTSFSIMDRSDQESTARTVLRDIRVSEKSLKPGEMISIVSRWKSAGLAHERAAEIAENDQEFIAAMGYRRYQDKLKSTASVDFDDILLLTERLFGQFPDALARHQQRFDHVQVDEYQDTNGIQFRLVEGLVREHRNLCVVGDDDQSIYGWRGADVRHILGFQSHFPDAKVVRLEENYRCTDRILDRANRLVKHNRDRHVKQLHPNKADGAEVRFLDYHDEQLEAEKVVGEIKFLHAVKGIPLRDFAILFRTNEQPRLFESELRRAGLRYVLMGSQSFFDRREIRDLLAYLKTLSNPHDETSLLRIINTPTRGISNATVQKILAEAVNAGCSFSNAIDRTIKAGQLAPKAATAVGAFTELTDRYRRRVDESPQNLDSTLRSLIEEIDYETEIEKQYKDPQQQLLRTEMVDQFVRAVTEYLEQTPDPTLPNFLESVALLDRDEEPNKEETADEDAIKLMTLHSAKGLEFSRIYMVGMEEGLLPHRRSAEGTREQIEEERRLCYVGITRAQDHLTLTRALHRRKWGKLRPSVPSRFLNEMRSEEEVEEDVEVVFEFGP